MILLFILGAFVVVGAVIVLVCIVQDTDLREILPVYCPGHHSRLKYGNDIFRTIGEPSLRIAGSPYSTVSDRPVT